jgi:hypothetical protein
MDDWFCSLAVQENMANTHGNHEGHEGHEVHETNMGFRDPRGLRG